jgi:hypothetical protein
MYLEVDDLLVLLSKLLLQLCSIVFGRLLLLCCFAFLLRLGWCGVRVPPYRRCCSCDGGNAGWMRGTGRAACLAARNSVLWSMMGDVCRRKMECAEDGRKGE